MGILNQAVAAPSPSLQKRLADVGEHGGVASIPLGNAVVPSRSRRISAYRHRRDLGLSANNAMMRQVHQLIETNGEFVASNVSDQGRYQAAAVSFGDHADVRTGPYTDAANIFATNSGTIRVAFP
jgi:hypothetical protein